MAEKQIDIDLHDCKRKTGSKMSPDPFDDFEFGSYTCAICLETYKHPMKISCGHIYCNSCLKSYSQLSELNCPLCREPFSDKVRMKEIEKKMANIKTSCRGCGKKLTLAKIRSHNSRCEQLKNKTFEDLPSPSPPDKTPPSPGPNRSTFFCPYCGLKNLTTTGLREHCNEKHKYARAKVVCPICSSMPWGDPSQKSRDFVQHLNLRHRFEYDTFVDFRQDDRAMLQAALKASLEEK